MEFIDGPNRSFYIDWEMAENLCRKFVLARGNRVSDPQELLNHITEKMNVDEDTASAIVMNFVADGPLNVTTNWELEVNENVWRV